MSRLRRAGRRLGGPLSTGGLALGCGLWGRSCLEPVFVERAHPGDRVCWSGVGAAKGTGLAFGESGDPAFEGPSLRTKLLQRTSRARPLSSHAVRQTGMAAVAILPSWLGIQTSIQIRFMLLPGHSTLENLLS